MNPIIIKKIQDRIRKLQIELSIATLELDMILEAQTIADENKAIIDDPDDYKSSLN